MSNPDEFQDAILIQGCHWDSYLTEVDLLDLQEEFEEEFLPA